MYGLETLAARVRKDDPSALGEMRHELEIQMVRIVRRVLRTGIADSALTRQILAEAGPENCNRPDLCPKERQQRIAQLAQRLCDSVLGALQSEPKQHYRMASTIPC